MQFYKDISHQERLDLTVKIDDNNYSVFFGLFGEEGSQYVYRIDLKKAPTREILEPVFTEIINKEIQDQILNGFVYKERRFYLSIENQINYDAFLARKDSITYPIKIRTSDLDEIAYMEIRSKIELAQFVNAARDYVFEKINESWTMKDEIDYSKFTDLTEE